jgi:hypothetical protein
MIYFLTHIKSKIPDHLLHCLRQLLFVEPDCKIVLCTDSNITFNESRIDTINLNDLSIPDIGDYFKYELDPLWVTSLQRVFILNSFLQKTTEDVVHFDNDVLIYHPLKNIVNELTEDVHITPQKTTEHVFGCSIIKNREKYNLLATNVYNAVVKGKQFVLSETGDQAHEMRLINHYGKQYIKDLPIHPSLGSINQMFFDPITYGQYFGGVHGGPGPGFIDKDHIAGKIIENNLKPIMIDNEPVIEYNNDIYKLINLHVHGKNLEQLASYNKTSKIKKDYCVVTFGKGYNFERGVDRLKQRCNELSIPFFGFTEYPEGCPTHEVSPFAFKFFCIRNVLQKGYKKILWLDSSVIIKRDISDVFEHITNKKYFFIYNHSLGPFCHDKALTTLGITREESFQLPCLQATNFGLNFNDKRSLTLLNTMLALAVDGITFPGPHNNNERKASKDPRVLGHRHEQTAMSVVAIKLGLNEWLHTGETPWFIHDRGFVKDVESTVMEVDMSL